MIADLISDRQMSMARAPRTNLFAMATIYTETGSMPVKVRNLSVSGARVEGPVLPPAGARVRICRGSLQVAAEVAWSASGSAGLRFESIIRVADWLPQGRSIAAQQRADDLVHQNRMSPTGRPISTAPEVPSARPTALELLRIKHAIESLADDLANDRGFVERHAPKLQMLDTAAQALGKLANS